MLRRVLLASALTLLPIPFAAADPMRNPPGLSPYGPYHSPSSSPFEAFEWTPLEFAAFQAYGGDFANIRKPVTPMFFSEVAGTPQVPAGPDDELEVRRLGTLPYAESTPLYDSMAQGSPGFAGAAGSEERSADLPIPEPGLLALIGFGLLGASQRLRRRFEARD